MTRYLLIPVLVLAAACGGAGGGGPADESTLERLERTGTARVGYANEAPYAYLDTESGRLTGEAPSVARAVLAEMGIEEVQGVLTEFGSLIPGLHAGRFDLIAAGMYVTPERCREIAFSEPSYSIGEAFIVAAGNPLGLHSYADVEEHPEARLGVVAGTVERGYAREVGIPDQRVVVFPDAPSAVAGVGAGRIDAFAGTSLTVGDLLAKAASEKIERAEPFTDPVIDGETIRGYGAFGFRKEDQGLVAEFNRHLEAFIGSERHLELVRPFGFTEAELPGDVTTAELCQP